MAQNLVTAQPALRWFPFAGLEEKPRERSDVPRGALIFDFRSVTIPGQGVGDSTRLVVPVVLPANFAYAVTDVYLSLFGADAGVANTWNDRGNCNLNNASNNVGREYTIFTTIDSPGTVQTGLVFMKSWRWMEDLPKFLIQPPGGSQAQLEFELINTTLDDQDYSLNAMIRVLTYDIAQTHHWNPNSPTLTR